VIGAIVATLAALLRTTGPVERIELPLIDVRTRLAAGERAPDPRIVLVEVTDADVVALLDATLEPWPWRLGINATLVDTMHEAGAKVLVVDAYHFDQGAGSDDTRIKKALSEPEKQQLDGAAEEAAEYGAALARLGRTVVAFELTDRPNYDVEARRSSGLARLAGKTAFGGERTDQGSYRFARAAGNWPVRRVAEGAAALGFANVAPDVDGIVRRAVVAGRAGDRPAASLALAAAALVADGATLGEYVAPHPLTVGGAARPIGDDASFYVDFRRATVGAYPRIAPWLILQWAEVDPATKQRRPESVASAKKALEGKIVVFGINLAGSEDLVQTPITANHPGPEFQATIIDDLLNGGGRLRASFPANTALLVVACLLAALAGTFLRGRVLPHLGALVVGAAVVAVAWGAFRAGVIFDVATPVAGAILASGAAFARRTTTQGRYNRWLEATTGRFLSPAVLDAIKRDPSLLDLGGRRRAITVLFSDVAGFTTISEKLAPKDVVELMNVHLTAHCDAVFEQGGTVDKFIGDAVMAFYGDPIAQDDHAARACRTALLVQERLPLLEPEWRRHGLTEFVVRIGLNSGEAIVGSMGSRHRSDYTCMGDTVNLASRLEGANKAFGTRILIGAATYDAAKGAIVAKRLGLLGVVGKNEPVAVYELLATRESAPPELLAHVAAFDRATEAARRGDLAAARAALAEAARLRPGDGPCHWFGKVLDRVEAGAEPSPWPGVIVLTGK